jgi:hypothetical protein
MTAPEECLDKFGREIPIPIAAAVKFLKSMGYDEAAECLRDGWISQPLSVVEPEQ